MSHFVQLIRMAWWSLGTMMHACYSILPEGNELELQFHMQKRTQKQNEKLPELAGEQVAKAYPRGQMTDARNWFGTSLLVEWGRHLFHLQLMREMPATLEAALESARKLKVVAVSQKRLQHSRHQLELCSIAIDDMNSEHILQANATQSRWLAPLSWNTSVQGLPAKVRKLIEERSTLRSKQRKVYPRQSGRRAPEWREKCWNCRMPGSCSVTALNLWQGIRYLIVKDSSL